MSFFTRIWHIRDLRKSLLAVLGMLVLFRIVAHIPVPGTDVEALRGFFQSNQFLGLLNVFSGGSMENFSVVALGVAPYITASIIFQLLAMVIPRLEEIQKEGEAGQRKINQYTRLATVPLALLQAYGLINLLNQGGRPLLGIMNVTDYVITMLTLTAGTMFLMWIGELISERKIGNGVSLIIFAGIISALPNYLVQAIVSYDASQLFNMIAFALIAVLTIAVVVVVTEGQRNIPVSFARQVRGQRVWGGTSSHLPLRVNMAGVIPIIFALSLLLLPPTVAQLLVGSSTAWIAGAARYVVGLWANQLFYGATYFFLVFFFTFFYTAIVFRADKIAENLQKQGGFIPGIRPGTSTSTYLTFITNRIIVAGAAFLGLIAVLPIAVQQLTGASTLVVGGTGLLIVVSVVIESMKQVQAQLAMNDYENL